MSSVLLGNVLYSSLIYYMLALCCFIPAWVFIVLAWQIFTWYHISAMNNENNWVEWAWTLIPTALVGYLCIINVICMVDDTPVRVEAIVKTVGRQWYWSYEIQGFESGYDSVICDFIDSVDKPLRLNLYDFYHFLVTSSDVIHSFAIPDLNVKVDAIPGRVNQCIFYSDKLGITVGYCSELCGAGHAYMPIVLETVYPDYKPLGWIPYEHRLDLIRRWFSF